MSEQINIAYHEVDFLLPIHRFDIRFSYVTKKGLPFIREFVLRLVHISPMQLGDIATFFGLSDIEVEEAVGDLVDKGDLQFTGGGQVELTSKSRGYFIGLGSTPLVSSLLESGGQFAFELAGFNCVGRKRTNDKWMSGLNLEVPNEIVANSERMVKRKFQENFHKIQEQGFWEHKSLDAEPGRPSIYTMESVRKLGQEPLRLTSLFSIDPEGVPVEREDFDILGDSSAVQELVTDAIVSAQKPMNFKQVGEAMAAFGDHKTRTLFNNHSIDIVKLMLDRQSSALEDGQLVPFVGPLYSKDNWQLINNYFERHLAALKGRKDHLADLIWLAPSDGFWGQSLRVASCFSELVDGSVSKGKNSERFYESKLYLPVLDSRDRRTIGRWKQMFSGHLSNAYGLVEGFMDGNVEILLLSGAAVVVCYHISNPERLPVSLPVGYISTDSDVVKVVEILVNKYIRDVVSFGNPRDLGPLSNL